MKARELLSPGETAIVIFTDGSNFHQAANGSGSTGYWVLDPARKYDKVIIYVRNATTQSNDVYVAEKVNVNGPINNGRYELVLQHIHLTGTTDANWREFAELANGAQNPIRYLTGGATSAGRRRAQVAGKAR